MIEDCHGTFKNFTCKTLFYGYLAKQIHEYTIKIHFPTFWYEVCLIQTEKNFMVVCSVTKVTRYTQKSNDFNDCSTKNIK